MGKINQGILGGFSGSVGPVTGSSWKGIAVLKSKPINVANPNTPAQQFQRGRIRTIVADARDLLANLIQPYWNPFAQRQSGYNRFVSTNIAAYNQTELDSPEDFYTSRGSLIGVANLSVAAVSGTDSVTFTWSNNAGQADALATDIAVAVYYNATKNYWRFNDQTEIRSSESKVMTDTIMEASDEIYGYLFFSRPNISRVSDSEYDSATVS